MGNARSSSASPAAADHESAVVATTGSKEESHLAGTSGNFDKGANFVHEEKKDQHEVKTPRAKKRPGDAVSSTHITDDQVHVNIAMADLMAYLQVVANNSNHLPLTRRDDPELDRTITTLSTEDYARKSAAFVPSDVRVIGGTFTRYGRVWDLPTSEEYNACDGAHEPGRSYGGACANAMLKVLYDAANDAADAAQTEAASAALFDEDDEDEDGSVTGRSYRSHFSLENGNTNPSTITWSELLRKMKAEIKEIEYAQVPKITTTRKIDLNKPFNLAPENFDAKKSKKRSLLIGCGYSNIHGAELKASHDDVRSMKDYIVNVHGFSEAEGLMTVLMDDSDHKHPTFMNIIEAFKALSEESQPGDAVFVQFSGHGGRVLDSPIDSEAESYDEVLVPCDYSVSGLIRDTLIFKTLLAPMRYGVTVTVMLDSCDTGTMLELPYAWTTRNEKRDSVAKLSQNEDFSFVRFLKVVKTLYETSTFTQLGRTVGSALGPLDTSHDNATKKSSESRSRKNDADDENKISSGQQSIFDTIAEACHLNTIGRFHEAESGKANSKKKAGIVTKTDGLEPRGSLLEQVMNCTLLAPNEDDYSDEEDDGDTFRTRTRSDDLQSMDESYRTYETATDDEQESRKAQPRRKRR